MIKKQGTPLLLFSSDNIQILGTLYIIKGGTSFRNYFTTLYISRQRWHSTECELALHFFLILIPQLKVITMNIYHIKAGSHLKFMHHAKTHTDPFRKNKKNILIMHSARFAMNFKQGVSSSMKLFLKWPPKKWIFFSWIQYLWDDNTGIIGKARGTEYKEERCHRFWDTDSKEKKPYCIIQYLMAGNCGME